MTKGVLLTYNALYVTFANRIVLGLVLVSTGARKFEEPSAGRDRVVNRTLKLNANDNLAYAA